jgi:DNA-binding NarL/FixJ family response regulator
VADAIAKIGSFDPHAVITDLNFGITEPSGADLLQYIEKEHPWVGKVVLTSHASPALAVPNGMALPAGVTYLVKSDLGSISDLVAAVENSISNLTFNSIKPFVENERILISSAQGEILELEATNLDVNESYSRDGLQLGSPKTSGKVLLLRLACL